MLLLVGDNLNIAVQYLTNFGGNLTMTNKLNIILLLLFFACSSMQAFELTVIYADGTSRDAKEYIISGPELSENTTIENLRKLVFRATGVPIKRQKLTNSHCHKLVDRFAGNELVACPEPIILTLKDWDIKSGDKIHLIRMLAPPGIEFKVQTLTGAVYYFPLLGDPSMATTGMTTIGDLKAVMAKTRGTESGLLKAIVEGMRTTDEMVLAEILTDTTTPLREDEIKAGGRENKVVHLIEPIELRRPAERHPAEL